MTGMAITLQGDLYRMGEFAEALSKQPPCLGQDSQGLSVTLLLLSPVTAPAGGNTSPTPKTDHQHGSEGRTKNLESRKPGSKLCSY